MEELDLEAAYTAYAGRFRLQFGDKPDGEYVKFGRHMVQKLKQDEFAPRLQRYLRIHAHAKRILRSGSTINDILALEFEEAAAWIAIEVPHMLAMFRGEVGDPDRATGRLRTVPPPDRA